MTKPDDIPQDVLDVAHGIAMDLPARIQAVNRAFAASVIARAILAERERCALVAEAQGRRYSEPAVGHSIATTIRNGSHS